MASSIGFMFGGELRIGGRHVAVVPGLRIAYSNVTHGTTFTTGFRGDLLEGEDEDVSQLFGLGYPQWTYRPSVSLRVDF